MLSPTTDPITAAASETGQLHAALTGVGQPAVVPAWRHVAVFKKWLERALAAAIQAQPSAASAAEWLLDNSFQVQRAAIQIRKDLPPGFYCKLVPLTEDSRAGEPRVMGLAHDLLRATHFQLSRQAILAYLEGYQAHAPLKIAELWALPVALRLACLERLVEGFAELFPTVPAPFPVSNSCRETVTGTDPTECVARALANLGVISSISWKDIFDEASFVERILARDPDRTYHAMDFATRDSYRRVVERLAGRCTLEETAIAERAVELASSAFQPPCGHVGYWLVGEGRAVLEREIEAPPPLYVRFIRWQLRRPGKVYMTGLLFFALVGLLLPAVYMAAMGATPFQWLAGIVLSALPASMISVTTVNWLVTQLVPPRILPKLDFSRTIGPEWTTVVAMPVIVAGPEEVPELLRRLESHRLANPQARAFVLLSDPPDAPEERLEGDDALERALVEGIHALNRRYGRSGEEGPFCLLHRARRYNSAQGCWMAWERKRGKLEEFNRFLLEGDASPFPLVAGPFRKLPGTRFVVTVDADTRLPPGVVGRLAGTLAHPLNRPRFTADGKVASGYTVLQPRIEIAPHGSESRFARLFGGDTAIDIYSRAVSDVFQDLTGTGSYAGKGIYDVDAFAQSLSGRIPENNLLSHDLWEGLHGRAGLVSDIIVYESFPANYGEYVRRWHRWVRGDWQLLPWLFPRVPGPGGSRLRNRLSGFDRMRIVDTMRRSLIPPSVLALLFGGWFLLPGSPAAWTLLAVVAPAAYLFTDLVTGLARGRRRGVLTGTVRQQGEHAGRWALSLAFLVNDSVVSLHAVITTLVRLRRRRRLLEWTSAAHVGRQLGRQNPREANWRAMWVSPATATALVPLLLTLGRPSAFAAALPLLLLWLAAPEIAVLTGRQRLPAVETLNDEDRAFLRKVARRSWLFFETHVRPEGNWLPPDNHQEEPVEMTAYRTSPTNVGLMAVATFSAWRFGHIANNELAVRMRNMLDSLDKLESWRGHMLNWYETRGLRPLEPRYVSTVDSGNLAVSLITLSKGCDEIVRASAFDTRRWHGLEDCLVLLEEAIGASALEDGPRICALITSLLDELRAASADPARWPQAIDHGQAGLAIVRQELSTALKSGAAVRQSALREIRTWLERSEHHLEVMKRDLTIMMPWLGSLETPPPDCLVLRARFAEVLAASRPLAEWAAITHEAEELRRLAEAEGLSQAGHEWLAQISGEIRSGLAAWRQLARQLARIAKRSSRKAEDMDFAPLYDPNQRLFHIGYNLSADRFDNHYYDLLASEARLASLFAIAKHDAPMEHWFQLGRPIVKKASGLALVSWNGSMFEYLMPALFLRSDESTLLGQSDRTAVDLQRSHGMEAGIPWGISESAYASVGPDETWRYRAFGVPDLGLRRGLAQDMVVAPYASALALAVRPAAAVKNLRELAALGMLGRCGFFEAADFTPSRLEEGKRFIPVRSYMAHHHGMSIAAITNALFDDCLVHLFHSDPRIGTVDLLLNERVPWELPSEIEQVEQPAAAEVELRQLPRPQAWQPVAFGALAPLHLIGNGRLSTRIAADGSGEIAWQGNALTTPGEFPGGNGLFLYLRDRSSGANWSPTAAPIASDRDMSALFHAHKAEFHCHAEGISSTLEILVAPGDDVEIRRLLLVNETDRERELEIASHAPLALAPAPDWMRHPAFARLFVAAETHAELDALLFTRRPRAPNEVVPAMLHRLVADGANVLLTGWEVERQNSWRRHGDAAQWPQFSAPMAERCAFPLDPVAALRAQAQLQPYGRAELAFVTIAAPTAGDALELARRYGSLASLDWAEQDAQERAARELHGLGLSPGRLADAQLLLTALLQRRGPATPPSARPGRGDLWAIGLSGDLPILLHECGEAFAESELPFLLAAQRLWRRRGVAVDLAVLHPGLPGYVEPVRERLIELLREAGCQELLGERGGVHLFGREQVNGGSLDALHVAAAIRLADGAGSIRAQVYAQGATEMVSPPFAPCGRPIGVEVPEGALPPLPPLAFDNGLGGFTAVGDYVIRLESGQSTPAPWSNVLANEKLGTIVTEAGLGFTFAGNSGENRLTPWYNDPLTDPQGEAVYLRDEETGEVWTITPQPAGDEAGRRITHAPGETIWMCSGQGLDQEQLCLVGASDPVKLVRVRLTDRLGTPRRLTVTCFVEWQLGSVRGEPGPFRHSRYKPEYHAILGSNGWQREFAGRTAFLTATLPPHGLTTSRLDFLGPGLDWRKPRGLQNWDLGGREASYGEDAAAALQLHVEIAPHATVEFAFILGEADNEASAGELIARWQDDSASVSERRTVAGLWSDRLGAVEVATPDPGFDLMVNRWLPYQAMSSRLFARAGFYQAGGAFGFRDQLQDVTALLHAAPQLARSHLLRAAAHQFDAGDVLHWWHPPAGRGVRTRYSDDLLWLPFAVARYVEATGDRAVLDERAPFLTGPELIAGEHDHYAEFAAAADGTLYEHCLRAFDRAWRLGAHGLPLIGEGDWNDGMNRVGAGGRGESVWLGWFMASTIRSFARMSDDCGRKEFGLHWLGRADELVAAIDRHCWDGGWYLRAFDDLGRPWGSRGNDECQIDSLTQSWATIAGGGDPLRASHALEAAFARLVRPDDRIVRLLDPPFAHTARDPGYIKAYPPGIRENGGQYSHAAAWLGIALAMRGDGDRAKAVFDRISPVIHAMTPEGSAVYRTEPYVVAADIAGERPHLGRGGWSWYTGAAAWSWRLAVEHILGIRLKGGRIVVEPCLPSAWPGYSATLRGKGAIHLSVTRGDRKAVMIDGAESEGEAIAFPGEGKARRVEMTIPVEP